MSKISLIAKLTAADGKADELEAVLAEVIAAADEEPGLEIYSAHQDTGNEGVYYFFEMYSDDDAFAVHGKGDGMKAASDCLLGRDDITDRLGEITCPAIVIHGTEDTAITMEQAEALASGLSGAGDVVKVGGAHAANMTNPEPVNAAIAAFLADLAA